MFAILGRSSARLRIANWIVDDDEAALPLHAVGAIWHKKIQSRGRIARRRGDVSQPPEEASTIRNKIGDVKKVFEK